MGIFSKSELGSITLPVKKKLDADEQICQPLSESTLTKGRYVGDAALKGWRAGCALGAVWVPITVMKYGHHAHAQPHHWMLTGLGKYALIGAVASALIGTTPFVVCANKYISTVSTTNAFVLEFFVQLNTVTNSSLGDSFKSLSNFS